MLLRILFLISVRVSANYELILKTNSSQKNTNEQKSDTPQYLTISQKCLA